MNGWTNRATWNAFTIISNTEWMYLKALELKTADKLQEVFGLDPDINWKEIEEAFSE